MRTNLLILGGTSEATALCKAVAEAGLKATLSLAGRVDRPLRQPLPMRVGGFGGAAGLASYLAEQAVTHVVDATHPFAAQMSANAVAGCLEVGVPLIALTRAPWVAGPGDDWWQVPDIAGAVEALRGPRRSVMLAVGRMHLAAFAPNPQHRYLLRLIDPPVAPLPFPEAEVVVGRGPFSAAGDRALMERHGIELVVSKNAGGLGAVAKIHAARALGLPVIMIDRPALPLRREVHGVAEVMAWLAHGSTDLGV
ncbi:cobalt-precorrin-6A reductase [Sedimentitalea sp. JM2-8]|uniref:Cobalt-precorrin-6A reductase n=1 Tax=Sedimentitalea xiamensis TaxID=3050037 RepID=A0ABT7FH88_9RHOB|nr:cobalt-precorrin-6A reductase [Sedimentitalea xiamensis]MDK3074501.1 cobalt-precorrin-6A reductase [Sedimentitalea xiamensis]